MKIDDLTLLQISRLLLSTVAIARKLGDSSANDAPLRLSCELRDAEALAQRLHDTMTVRAAADAGGCAGLLSVLEEAGGLSAMAAGCIAALPRKTGGAA
jgi:hypothetical protein